MGKSYPGFVVGKFGKKQLSKMTIHSKLDARNKIRRPSAVRLPADE